jgi:hypothetical protein
VTSARRLAANRENAIKSTGPRTGQGKSRSRGNALRHGFAAAHGYQEVSEKVERLARELYKDDTDPFRLEQAIIIAESQILITRIRAARIAAIEHMRKSPRPGELIPGGPTTEEWAACMRDFRKGNFRRAMTLVDCSNPKYEAFANVLLAGMTAKTARMRRQATREAERMIRARLEETYRLAPEEREDAECVRRALPDLLGLERYEKRALSRRKRAILRFDQLGDSQRLGFATS